MLHLDLPLLTRVLDGELPPSVLRDLIVEHLRELCPECRAALDLLESDPEAEGTTEAADPVDEDRYRSIFRHLERHGGAWVARAARERPRARRELAELLRHPPAERQGHILRARTRFRTRAFAEALFAAVRERVRSDPTEAEGLAALMPPTLDRIPDAGSRPWARTLRLRTEAWRANALRVAGRLREATRAFAHLRARLSDEDLHNPALLAEIARLEASVHIDAERLSEATRLLDQAVRYYRSVEDTEGLAAVLIKRGTVADLTGDAEGAIEMYNEVLACPDPGPFAACAAANVALVLWEQGRADDARDLLEKNGNLFARHADSHSRAQLQHISGRVDWALGRRSKAEIKLLEARDTFSKEGSALRAALVTLDLAVMRLEEGRTQEAREIARTVGELFQVEQLDSCTMAAVALFQAAAAAENVTVRVVRDFQRQLEMLLRQPRVLR